MGPKIDAAIRYIEAGGREVLITRAESLARGPRGEDRDRAFGKRQGMKRDYVNENDWAPAEIAADPRPRGASEAGARASTERALAGKIARDDLREVLDAHARLLRGRDVPARRASGCFSPRGTCSSAGASRSPTRRGSCPATSTAIMARVYAQATVEGLARARLGPGHQRAVRSAPSLPGARGFPDGPRAVRRRRGDFRSATSATATTWRTACS